MRTLFKWTAIAILVSCLSAIGESATVDSLRVMTFNIKGGGFGAQSLARTAQVIAAAQADIVGLQEASSLADDIAAMLGFQYHAFNSDLSIVSRYPVAEVVPGPAGGTTRGVKLQLSLGQEVYLFDTHLAPYPYQPYDIRDGLISTEAQAISGAQAARGTQVTALLNNMSSALATNLPVFLVGDFNEPSHLDWTQKAADAALNFNMKVDWPTSHAVTNTGLTDAFREVRPDEVNDQARTWTPGYPPPILDANEVHDRIDFVYYRGPTNVVPVEALTLGHDANDGFTDIAITPYPSDHRAVVVEFDLNFVSGDFDNDGDVDGQDFLVWQRGDSPRPLSAEDLADWQASYGTGSLAARHAVPEPSSWLLIVIACLFIVSDCGVASREG